MKKIGLVVLILTAVLILALAFLENRIDGPWNDSSKESKTSTSGTSMTTDTSGTTDVSDTTETTETTETTAPPPVLCAHDWKWESSTAICSKDGEALYRCSLCGETKTEYDAAYGCYDEDTNGLCDGCGIVTGECLHRIVTEKGYAATCTSEGLSDRRHCEKCDIVLEEHTPIPALGHQPAVLEAVPSTCISTGLTEGEHCARCKLVLKSQDTVSLGDHVGSEGVCTVCHEITDPKLALGFYIVKNGTKRDDRESYFISKSVEKFIYLDRYTGLLHIEFNPQTLELTFWGESTTMGVVGNMTMVLDMNSTIQKIDLEGTYKGSNGYAIGTIDAKTFAPNNMIIEKFEYDAGSRTENEQWYKAYFSIAISEMLILGGEMVTESGTGVTMAMLGFLNY